MKINGDNESEIMSIRVYYKFPEILCLVNVNIIIINNNTQLLFTSFVTLDKLQEFSESVHL